MGSYNAIKPLAWFKSMKAKYGISILNVSPKPPPLLAAGWLLAAGCYVSESSINIPAAPAGELRAACGVAQ